ncbi:MAG: hypothetical protein QXU18_00050 [Thermoplasmatales archaeon]
MCSITQSYGIGKYFLPKANSSFRAKDPTSRKTIPYDFPDDRKSWLEDYYTRSLSECVNSMIKRKVPVEIRNKLPQRNKTEETLRVNMHNLRQYNYLKHTNPGLIKNYKAIPAKDIVSHSVSTLKNCSIDP